MSDNNENTEREDIQEKKWSELKAAEKEKIRDKIEKSHKATCSIHNKYNFLIYSWCLVLNSGGLIGALTLLQMGETYQVLCIILSIIFSLGISSILIANSLEKRRWQQDLENIEKEFESFKNNQTVVSYFLKKISENNQNYWSSVFERASIYLFFIGVTWAVCASISFCT